MTKKKAKTFKPVSKSVPVKEKKEKAPKAPKAPKGPSPERIARMSRFQKEALGIG